MLPEIFSPSEVIALFLSVLVTIYALYHLDRLRHRRYILFVLALYCLDGALVVTHLEEVILTDLLNILEHALLAAGAFLVASGCRVFLLDRRGGEGQA